MGIGLFSIWIVLNYIMGFNPSMAVYQARLLSFKSLWRAAFPPLQHSYLILTHHNCGRLFWYSDIAHHWFLYKQWNVDYPNV